MLLPSVALVLEHYLPVFLRFAYSIEQWLFTWRPGIAFLFFFSLFLLLGGVEVRRGINQNWQLLLGLASDVLVKPSAIAISVED